MKAMTRSTAACVRRVRATLPPEAFAPNAGRLWMMAAHASVVAGGYAVIRAWPTLGPLASICIGHSLACLAFAAHELSHNAVVRHRGVKYVCSLLALGINFVPPTMWNRLHNLTHHRHASTVQDPDRPFLEGERGVLTTWYSRVFYPSRRGWRTYPTVLSHFVTYISRNIAAVFYPGAAKPAIMTSKPAYRPRERAVIALEVAILLAMQYGVWVATGRSRLNYAWASPAALCVASAVIMSYVFTNHFLNPIAHDHDPIAGTTSVVVPRLIDRLHCNFSYHTEHHLFPSLNADYYPAVSAALKAEAGDRYQQLPFREAWRRLWEQDAFRRLDGGAGIGDQGSGIRDQGSGIRDQGSGLCGRN
jgi:fatty acid desaturase